MSNKQNTKRVLSIDEDLNPKKNKTLEKSTSSIDFSGKVHNSPTPLIEVFQISDDESTGSDNAISSEDEQRSHNRETIVPEWLELYPWLEVEVSNEKTIIYCKICRTQNGNTNFAKGSSNLRLSGIKKHSNSGAHKKFELLETEFIDLTNQLSSKKLTIISLMQIVYFCSKKNISMKVYPDICNLMFLTKNKVTNDKKFNLKPASIAKPSSSKSTYGSYANNKSGSEFLECIVSVIQKELIEELNSSPYWSIMIDETNTINNKYLAIVGKYMVDNIPYMRYLGMIDLETTDGENVFNQIISFCDDKEITSQKIIHFGSDGASNMTGYKSGVAARLKKINPFMSSNHCVSHRLHLAGKDASNEVLYFEKYEKTLKNLYAFFSKSHKRQSMLRMMQDINDEPPLKILNLCDTRWLSFSNSVSNLYKIMDSVLATLDDYVNEGDKHAQLLYDQLDQDFILATMYLADLTNILKKLINTFQLDFLSLSQFKKSLNNTINEIEYEFIDNEQFPSNNGLIFKEYLNKNNFDSPPFIKEYSIAIIDAIQKRFPQTELYSSFSIFDPKEIPDDDEQLNLYGNREIEFLSEFYGEIKFVDGEEFQEIIDKNQLFEEWCLVKYILQLNKSNELDFINFWKSIFDTDEDFSFNYPNISLLVKISLIIPLSNANVERIFSQTKLIKNKLRNKMNLDTLNNHLMILLNGPEIEDFNFEKACEYWEDKKNRRINS